MSDMSMVAEWLIIISGVISILNVLCMAFTAWLVQKIRADLLTMQMTILNTILDWLKNYVPKDVFETYIKAKDGRI